VRLVNEDSAGSDKRPVDEAEGQAVHVAIRV
jgi:hypothetical protein